MNRKKIRNVLFILGLCFIAVLVHKSWDQLNQYFLQLKWDVLFLSISLALIGNLLLSHLYQGLLGKYNVTVSFFQTVQMFFYAQITKYIPGKIWSIYYQITHLNSPNTTSGIVLANIDLTLVLLFTVSAYAVGILLWGYGLTWFFLMAISLCLGLLFYVLLRLNWLIFFIKKIKWLTKYLPEKIQDTPSLSWQFSAYFFIAFFISYVFSNYFMLQAIFSIQGQQALVYVACLSLAWVIGVLTVISPSGIGIREAAFIWLGYQLNTDIPLEILASIAVVSRLWMISQEIVGAVLLMAAIRWLEPRQQA